MVVIGEFGRTPKINANGGRDHWGHVFSFALAGAGIRGAQVHGSSDQQGAYPRTGKMEPQDLTATILHLLGISHEAFFTHPTGRLLHVTEGTPLYGLLGDHPATNQRAAPGGNLALVPPFTSDLLLNVGFEERAPLIQVGSGKRFKGWQATPLLDGAAPDQNFGVRLVKGSAALPSSGQQHVVLGYDLKEGKGKQHFRQGSRAMLTQEVRSPRAGRYTFSVHACGGGSSAEYYRKVFLKHFACRLRIFGYLDGRKDPSHVREFASVAVTPPYADRKTGKYQKFAVSVTLRSQDDGAMEIEKGVGVAVIVEKVSAGEVDGATGSEAFIRIDDVEIQFNPRPRNDEVQV